MSKKTQNGNDVGASVVVELRSDTHTRPTPGMRQAMAEAEVGDDVYGEDPTVIELQRRCAELFGMEDTLFVPTGTMGNLIAIMVHCEGRGLEAIVGHKSHILLNEQGGIAQFAGVMTRTIQNNPDGTFDLEELKSVIRPLNDCHQPFTRLICVENTQNFCGGRALPLSFLKQVYDIAQEHKLLVHMDGARVMNAATALDVPVSDILQYTNSVSLCFSKGLSAPVGSILGGTKAFIQKAVRLRKALGGGMRQVGVLAAAAIYSLDHIVPTLAHDHKKAQKIAHAIMAMPAGILSIDAKCVDTNILTIEVVKPGLTAAQFCIRMAQVSVSEKHLLGASIVVNVGPIYPQVFRILTHHDITDSMVTMAIKKLQHVVKEFAASP